MKRRKGTQTEPRHPPPPPDTHGACWRLIGWFDHASPALAWPLGAPAPRGACWGSTNLLSSAAPPHGATGYRLPATGSGQRARAAPLEGGDHLPVCPGLLRALDGSVVSECLGSCREGAGTLPRTPWRVQRRKGKGLGTSDCFESRAESSDRREGRKYFRAFRESLESQAVSGGRNCLAPQREGRRREKGWTQKKWRGKKGDGRNGGQKRQRYFAL